MPADRGVTASWHCCHAKNVALLHLPTGTELAPIYDALPNLFQQGLVSFDLALAVDGVFDHRRISVERVVAEARSWGLTGAEVSEPKRR